ncbi:MAG: YihY/virulence factor BrkB family protein [Leptolyngbyaceae cyanobacterium MO_188.B28]|nr:YihY/virulence factor BrkB family protein [Leptolyngbyaceae cyanobacterium MO_188.B28]
MIKAFIASVRQSKIVHLLIQTFLKWQQDECLEMGAALSYYALFSFFPIILVILSIFGVIVEPTTDLSQQLLIEAQKALPPSAFSVVKRTLSQLYQGSASAGLVSFGVLFFTASGFFSALDRYIDKIWRTHPSQMPNQNLMTMVLGFVGRKLFAFVLIFGAAALILVSLLSTLAIDLVLKIVENFSNHLYFITIDRVALLSILQLGASLITLTLVVIVLFKILPSTQVAWGDIWLGALITATSFVILQQLVSNSVISLGSRFQSYGVVGGVMVLMLWIYLTSQIFFLGAEFTYIYAHLFGSRKALHAYQQRFDNSPNPYSD